jgi:hypothetical protein
MNLISYNLCDDWGWYVDTDNALFINSNKFHLNIPNRSCKMMNYHYNRLYTIDETDDYLKQKYKDIENLEIHSNYKKIDKKQEKNNNSGQTLFYRIGSTTLITALLTCAIYFLI